MLGVALDHLDRHRFLVVDHRRVAIGGRRRQLGVAGDQHAEVLTLGERVGDDRAEGMLGGDEEVEVDDVAVEDAGGERSALGDRCHWVDRSGRVEPYQLADVPLHCRDL